MCVIVCPLNGLISLPTAVFSIYSEALRVFLGLGSARLTQHLSSWVIQPDLYEFTDFRRGAFVSLVLHDIHKFLLLHVTLCAITFKFACDIVDQTIDLNILFLANGNICFGFELICQ